MKRTRSLGIACPEGREIYELYLSVESRPSILARIATILGERNIDILTGHLQCSDDKLTGHEIFYLEMADATVTPDELVETLKRQDFVKDAEIQNKSDLRFETMMFPLTRSGHTRVFVLSADGWVALVDSILDTFGAAGGVILHNQGVSVGAEVVESIRALFHGRIQSDLELENLKAYFGAVGLGILTIAGNGKTSRVTIENPVSSGQERPVVDQFLVGVVRGALAKIYSRDYFVQNLAARGGNLVFDLLREDSHEYQRVQPWLETESR